MAFLFAVFFAGKPQRAESRGQRALRTPLSALRLFNFEPAVVFILFIFCSL